jgi:hypothetical protein
MTRLPTESRDVTPHPDIPTYRVKPICSHPTCSRFTEHAHHICRRSFIIGDIAWVSYEDGPIVGNLAGLCWMHHEDITRNRAGIIWENRLKQYTWVDEQGVSVGKLSPHPPIHGEPAKDDPRIVDHLHGPGSAEVCPTCSRPIRRPKDASKLEEKKRRKTWLVTVPDEAAEDGALVLDVMVEELAVLFGREDSPKLRYYVLTQALALLLQNEHLL